MAVLERDYRIDGIKWLLIVLVTFGHVIEPALSNPIANKLYSIIYIFHMPLFVFISGYYANVKNKEKLISKGFMLLETFFGCDDSSMFLLWKYHPFTKSGELRLVFNQPNNLVYYFSVDYQ